MRRFAVATSEPSAFTSVTSINYVDDAVLFMADLNKWDSARLPSFETAARSVSPQITDLKTEIRTIDACVMGVFTCSRKLFEYSSSLVYECFVALASGAKMCQNRTHWFRAFFKTDCDQQRHFHYSTRGLLDTEIPFCHLC